MTIEEIDQFVKKAKPGDRVVYHRGFLAEELGYADSLTLKQFTSHVRSLESGEKILLVQKKIKKKDWKVTLSYEVRHNDTYLITNQTEKDAIYIAENQNQSSKCICIKEDEEDIEDVDTTIKEVVFNSEKKDWIAKEVK